jgi:hypothetical protein
VLGAGVVVVGSVVVVWVVVVDGAVVVVVASCATAGAANATAAAASKRFVFLITGGLPKVERETNEKLRARVHACRQGVRGSRQAADFPAFGRPSTL